MTSQREQEGNVPNPFLNPMRFWENYLIYWIEASRNFYANAIKTNEQWFKAFWDPWLADNSIALVGNFSTSSILLKSLTVKLGGSWNNIAPNFFVLLNEDILSRNSSKYLMAPLLTSNRLTCALHFFAE